MNPARILLSSLIMLALIAPSLATATETPNTDVQKVVDEIKGIAAKARKDRSADPSVLNALDDLVQKYYWPWRKQLLDESFKDGDYTKNPAWTVASGSFQVDASLGLRSSSTAAPAAPATKEKKQSLGDIVKQAVQAEMDKKNKKQAAAAGNVPAEIDLALKVTNAFALDLSFTVHQPTTQAGRIEFGLYQGSRPGTGYQLAFSVGPEPVAELLRVQSDGSSVVQRKSLGAVIPTGQVQRVAWRRDPDGNMTVLLNDKALLQATDRGYTAAYGSFVIVNRGGDFAVRSVTLSGVE